MVGIQNELNKQKFQQVPDCELSLLILSPLPLAKIKVNSFKISSLVPTLTRYLIK